MSAAPRVHVAGSALVLDAEVALPAGAARHAQVLRLQPGAPITLFDGSGGEWAATVIRMGRSDVSVRVGAHRAIERELERRVTLAFGMPANERLDALVEKATEIGASAIEPLVMRRSVVRLTGERAQRRREHLQAVAVAACEQCGRNRVPAIAPVATLEAACRAWADEGDGGTLLVLSTDPSAEPLRAVLRDVSAPGRPIRFVSGPEGGLTPDEEAAVVAVGGLRVGLGPRTLRADTAPLVALSLLT